MMKKASDRLDKGGITLWRHTTDKFSIIVYQTMVPSPYKGLSDKEYSLVEIRIMSAPVPISKFWEANVKRLTHKKWNWFLACMNPKKSIYQMNDDLKGTEYNMVSSPYKVNTHRDFKSYEDIIDRAEEEAKDLAKELAKLNTKASLGRSLYQALILKEPGKTPGSFEEKFWVIVLYPDALHWVIKIDHGLSKNFGKIYPSYWEQGFKFENYNKALDFYETKLNERYAKGYVLDVAPETKKLLKWSIQEAISKS